MNRLLVLAVAVGALASATPALAKGPAEATITGPGIKGGAIHLRSGGGDPMSGTPLGSLAEDGGFYPAAYGQSPDPMVRARPRGELGPKYSVEYRVPGPNGRTDTIRQDLYPYASIGPVTYMKSGQRFFGDQRTHGGWYVAALALKSELVKAGLPATPPSGGSSDDWTPLWSFVTVLAVALGLAGAALMAARRRPRPAGA
jgi:hypothetical protein